ncbi:uncharacterized protein LOC6565543 isoform X2 [Drosophila grimshawi]|nr:uncharacterized protein LOC6565543 isoform X2 [Drosophila grimshawi]
MEELSSSDSDMEADVPDKGYDVQLERELPLVPRLRYKASKVGNNILAGIDYVGGGLASFLGISGSKYASELKYHQREREQKESDAAATDEDPDNNWQSQATNNNSSRGNNRHNNRIVVCEPVRSNGYVEAQPQPSLPPSRQ